MKIVIAFMLTASFFSFSATKHGHNFPEKITLEKNTFVLNGLGMRLATWFNVKVYVGALYLNQKNNNPEEIINSKTSKIVRMAFVRDVEAGKIRSAWQAGLNDRKFEQKLTLLNSYMEDIKKSENIRIVFHANEVSVYVKGKHKGKIQGKQFSKGLLAVFIGDNPPNSELKNGMLGN